MIIFFTLGGHSLFATQVVSRIRDRFEVELSLRYLFESTTLTELGDRIANSTQDKLNNMEERKR